MVSFIGRKKQGSCIAASPFTPAIWSKSSSPYSDVLHGSKKLKNLKELRNQTQNHLLRVSYYFDSARKAFLLTGGDKKGKKQDKFYKDLIAESEVIVERHEKELENERCNQNDGK